MSGSSPAAVLARGGAILGGALLLTIVLAALGGAVPLDLQSFVRGDTLMRTILLDIRLPRILLGALTGAILASAGVTFQTLLRNPLADPFVLGVSGGAACGAALATAFGWARYPGAVAAMAFGGACLAIGGVLALGGRRGNDSVRLLLSGLVLNSFFTAIILLSLAASRGSDLAAALRWMMGSLAGSVWSDVVLLAAAFAVCFGVLAFISGDLRLLAFGEEDARSRGVDTRRTAMTGFLAASLATGAAVAVGGIIGFIGLLVPHLIRLVWRGDYRVLLPLSALGGAILLVASDALARTLAAPGELPIGALTALLGVPFFLLLLRKS